MIDIIEGVIRIFVHKRLARNTIEIVQCIWRIIGYVGSQDFRHIISILWAIEKVERIRSRFNATINTNTDSSSTAATTLGCDLNNAIGTLGTIESSTGREYFHIFDILYVKTCQHVVEEAIVDGRSIILQIPNNTIDNNQRLSCCIKWVQTIDEHGSTLTRHSTTHQSTNRTIQRIFNIAFNRDGSGIVGRHRIVTEYLITILEEGFENGIIEIHIYITIFNSNLNRIVFGSSHIQSGNKHRNGNGITTVLISHRSVTDVIQCLYLNTTQRLLGSSIENLSTNFFHLIGRSGRQDTFLGNLHFLFFLYTLINILSIQRRNAYQEEKAQAYAKGLFQKIISSYIFHRRIFLNYQKTTHPYPSG